MPDPGRTRALVVRTVVLAAGASRRFGSDKLLAELDGRPILQHVLDRLAASGIADPVVVTSPARQVTTAGLSWRGAHRIVNRDPGAGLASSLKLGWGAALAASPVPDAVLIVLGDQPRLSPAVVQALLAAPADRRRPFVAPRYRGGGGPNPVRIEASAEGLVAAASGDRGLGPLVSASPGLVRWLDVEGSNPDVDLPADLAKLAHP